MFKYNKTCVSLICCKKNVRNYKTDNKIRVRFAPSPTGYLHLGGLRTALYNFLFAKKYNGKFILRIEDTDQTRLVKDATEQLQNDLDWCGIEINEGPNQGGTYGPYLQSHRLEIYKKHVEILVNNKSAYHCFCTDKRLQLLRREAIRAQEVPKYDNRCRHLSPEDISTRINRGEPFCIRFKINDKEETFNDLIYGQICHNVSLSEGDPVIIKSDGFPTYHFANVVDDHLMRISHVFRGVEWQVSTTKHILLYRAFNWQPPFFGHLPLLLNADGTKLSKRQGDIKVSHYRENYIFPLALINFIIHSGGGFTKDLERNTKPKCYSIDELSGQFNIEKVNSHSGKLMHERLLEFNQLELKRKLSNEYEENHLIDEVIKFLEVKFAEKVSENSLEVNRDYVKKILHWSSNRINKLSDLFSKDLEFIWSKPNLTILEKTEIKVLDCFLVKFKDKNDLNKDNLNYLLRGFCKEKGLKFSKFMGTMRLVLSGLKEGPSVSEMILILGKENSLQRIEDFVNKAKKLR